MLLLQALGKWIANNWRPHVTVKASKSQARVTKIDAVWRTQRAAVDAELKIMLGVDELDSSTQAYFQQRTAAAKRVYDRMDEAEKAKIEEAVEKLKTEGNKPEVQRRCVDSYGMPLWGCRLLPLRQLNARSFSWSRCLPV
jgi:hypothetical protein